jgi:hypothetical protein
MTTNWVPLTPNRNLFPKSQEWLYTPIIPATQEAGNLSSWFEAILEKKKFARPDFKNKLNMVVHTCKSSSLGDGSSRITI